MYPGEQGIVIGAIGVVDALVPAIPVPGQPEEHVIQLALTDPQSSTLGCLGWDRLGQREVAVYELNRRLLGSAEPCVEVTSENRGFVQGNRIKKEAGLTQPSFLEAPCDAVPSGAILQVSIPDTQGPRLPDTVRAANVRSNCDTSLSFQGEFDSSEFSERQRGNDGTPPIFRRAGLLTAAVSHRRNVEDVDAVFVRHFAHLQAFTRRDGQNP